MSETVRQWEDLRKQARQLENEIDSKLLVLSRHGAQETRGGDDESSDKVPLLSDFSTDLFERISSEIDSLLVKLSDINNRMSQYADQLVKTPSATYTLQRHRDIFNDYTKEFKKSRANIMVRREREQLLKPTNNAEMLGVTGANKRTDVYMKEQEHTRNSEQLVDDQINIAIRTKENLRSQRTTLKAIHTQMTTLANRFPIINSLVNKIGLKKKKDTIIIGSVIGLCLFLFIIYKI